MENQLLNEEAKDITSMELLQLEIKQKGKDTLPEHRDDKHCEEEFMRLYEGDMQMRPAYDILQKTNHSLVITGYDNTTLLKFIELARSVMLSAVALALTKSGAMLINGRTIHSTLRLPIEFVFPEDEQLSKISFSKNEYYDWIFHCQLLIISEISMISAAMLDCINVLLQNAFNNKKLFGGIRIIFIGDPFQLPAIVAKADQLKMLKNYKSDHFSESKAFKELDPIMLEISNTTSAPNDSLHSCLEKIRKYKDIPAAIKLLNTRYTEKRVSIYNLEIDSTIILCFKNTDALPINRQKFYQLKTDLLIFEAEETGKFEWGNLKVPQRLELREGTRVMLTENQHSGAYPFGTLGYISTLTPDKVVDTPDVGDAFEVEPEKWYTTETKNYKDKKKGWVTEYIVVGTMTQYPLVYAWAFSIHQCQGQTFENVYLYDPGYWFALMHRYAALSRARTLEGLTLHKKLVPRDFKLNKNAAKFSAAVKREKRVKQILKNIKST